MADYIDAERAALLPCPFCGGPVKLEKAHQGRHEIYGMRQFRGVVCRNTTNHGGTCCMEQVPSASPEAAVARWNLRTPSASTGEDGLPELPKQPEELRARWKCEDCDGTGEIGELIDQAYFQPPERARCTSCDGAGQVECEALLPEQVKEYAREAIAADRRAREMAHTAEMAQWARDNGLNVPAQLEVTVTNYGNTVDKSAPEVKIERGRVWIVRGNQSFMLAYVPDEGDDPAEMQAYADNLRSALSGFTPCVNLDAQGAASPQAAQGVKTWQERESAYETEPMRQIDQMDAEIAELRAQMARLSHGEPLAWRFKRRGDRFWQTTADREVAASIGGANVEIVPLYAAPPLSSEPPAVRNAPMEPTTEMAHAGREALLACGNHEATERDAELCWSAMIEAMLNREGA